MQARSVSFNLEPTFRCNLLCEMCPRFSSEDPYLDMAAQTYQRICDAMGYAHTVDFTGWGEPMLHPRIYEMVAEARGRGCAATMTSNGTVFNERNSLRLIEAGMNRLTISVDGMTAETFEAIRTGASFDKLTRDLARFSGLIEREKSGLELGVAFTLQKGNAGELELIVPWLRKVGARVLHLKQLNVISNRDDWERSFLEYRLSPRRENGGRLARLEQRLLEVKEEAEAAGLRVLIHSELPLTDRMEGRHCLATPLESVYFSFEGRVAPCCHFGHHVSRYFEGQFHPPKSLFYGDIRTQTLEEIWEHPAFESFRHGFETRDFPPECRTCYLLYGK